MEKYVLKHITRPDSTVIAAFEQLDVSTVYEAQGKLGLLDHHLRPILPDTCIAGPAVTVTCPAGDNLMIHAAIEVCRPGDILVVTTIGKMDAGMIGELIATALMKRGLEGMIIDSALIFTVYARCWKRKESSIMTTNPGCLRNRSGERRLPHAQKTGSSGKRIDP